MKISDKKGIKGLPVCTMTMAISVLIVVVIAIVPSASIVGRTFKMDWGTSEYETYRTDVCKSKFEKMKGISDKRYRIVPVLNENSYLAVDDSSGYVFCSQEDTKQEWIVKYTASGYIFRYQDSQKVLDIEGASTEPGTRAQQWDYNGDISQCFEMKEVENNVFAIIYVGDMALTFDEASGNVIVKEYTGDKSQMWRFM